MAQHGRVFTGESWAGGCNVGAWVEFRVPGSSSDSRAYRDRGWGLNLEGTCFAGTSEGRRAGGAAESRSPRPLVVQARIAHLRDARGSPCRLPGSKERDACARRFPS